MSERVSKARYDEAMNGWQEQLDENLKLIEKLHKLRDSEQSLREALKEIATHTLPWEVAKIIRKAIQGEPRC